MTGATFNIGENKAALREETTCGRYVRVEPDLWWDTRTLDQGISHADLQSYLEAHPGVGIMVDVVNLSS